MTCSLQILRGGSLIATVTKAQPHTMSPEDYARANSYWCPVGCYPGRAWVLVDTNEAGQIANTGVGIELLFSSDLGTQLVKGLSYVRGHKVMSGATSTRSMYLVELADRRIYLSRVNQNMPDSIFDMPVMGKNYRDASYFTNGDAKVFGFTVPDIATPPKAIARSGMNAADWASIQCAMYGCWMVFDPLTGLVSIKRMSNVQSGTNIAGTPLYAAHAINNDQFDIKGVCWSVPMHCVQHGFTPSQRFGEDVESGSMEYRNYLHVEFPSDGGSSLIQPFGNYFDGTLAQGDPFHLGQYDLCLPYWSFANYSVEGVSDPFNQPSAITNRDEILSDCSIVTDSYRQDSNIVPVREIHPGFHSVTPGPLIKALIYKAGDTATTEIIKHPGFPVDYDGHRVRMVSWPTAHRMMGMPGKAEGWRTKPPAVEMVQVTDDEYDIDRRVSLGNLVRFNGLESSAPVNVEILITEVISSSNWDAPPPGFYFGRMIWAQEDKPIFAIAAGGSGSKIVDALFLGTANEQMNNTVVNVEITKKYFGYDASENEDTTYVWTNPLSRVCPVGYSVVGLGKFNKAANKWDIIVVNVEVQHKKVWIDPDLEPDNSASDPPCVLRAFFPEISIETGEDFEEIDREDVINFDVVHVGTDIAYVDDINGKAIELKTERVCAISTGIAGNSKYIELGELDVGETISQEDDSLRLNRKTIATFPGVVDADESSITLDEEEYATNITGDNAPTSPTFRIDRRKAYVFDAKPATPIPLTFIESVDALTEVRDVNGEVIFDAERLFVWASRPAPSMTLDTVEVDLGYDIELGFGLELRRKKVRVLGSEISDSATLPLYREFYVSDISTTDEGISFERRDALVFDARAVGSGLVPLGVPIEVVTGVQYDDGVFRFQTNNVYVLSVFAGGFHDVSLDLVTVPCGYSLEEINDDIVMNRLLIKVPGAVSMSPSTIVCIRENFVENVFFGANGYTIHKKSAAMLAPQDEGLVTGDFVNVNTLVNAAVAGNSIDFATKDIKVFSSADANAVSIPLTDSLVGYSLTLGAGLDLNRKIVKTLGEGAAGPSSVDLFQCEDTSAVIDQSGTNEFMWIAELSR